MTKFEIGFVIVMDESIFVDATKDYEREMIVSLPRRRNVERCSFIAKATVWGGICQTANLSYGHKKQ